MTQSAEDPLVAKAFDANKHEELARAIEKLSSEDAAYFLHKLEHAIRKRKIQLTGYLVAMAVWLVTMVLSLLYVGTQDGFTLWIFAIPFGCVGAILYGFGRWAERVAKAPLTAPPTAVASQKAASATSTSATSAPANPPST